MFRSILQYFKELSYSQELLHFVQNDILSRLEHLIPLAALYAETHYRFRWFPFSHYYRRQPEIIFDAPHRLEPDETLPVTLIVKDAHRFPLDIGDVVIRASGGGLTVVERFPLNISVGQPFWHKLFEVNVAGLPPGRALVEAELRGVCRGRRIVTRQDNHPGLSHAPLILDKAADPLPALPGWSAGELHCHTEFGSDQVEFGAPLPVIARTAKAMGLGWAALTDHSYNLDDTEDDYLHDDPALPKWQRLWDETEQLNREAGGALLIPGEEVTVRSAKGRNVHLLVIGNKEFLPGSGDGAQKWFHTRSELSVAEALARLSPDAFAAAAHPFEPAAALERLLVGRGDWQPSDLAHLRLDGWQLLNDLPPSEVVPGLDALVKMLLTGKRCHIYAGNDAHGNFNRFRQVKLPMVRLWEREAHLFGRVTTRVRAPQPLTTAGVLKALKSGDAVVSTGPALSLEWKGNDADHQRIIVRYATSSEFGAVSEISIHTARSDSEVVVARLRSDDGTLPDGWCGEAALPAKGGLYLRAELSTVTGHRAWTNPLWVVSFGF
jgi:hypothetical protein